jgi:hypothetical protein
MCKAQLVTVLGLALVAAGCQSNAQFLDANQAAAEQTALKRGQFEMSCTAVTPTVLSREVVEPAIEGPRMYGVARAEYTIGVSGCGDRKTFVVLCPDGGDGCFAAGPGRFYGEQ